MSLAIELWWVCGSIPSIWVMLFEYRGVQDGKIHHLQLVWDIQLLEKYYNLPRVWALTMGKDLNWFRHCVGQKLSLMSKRRLWLMVSLTFVQMEGQLLCVFYGAR